MNVYAPDGGEPVRRTRCEKGGCAVRMHASAEEYIENTLLECPDCGRWYVLWVSGYTGNRGWVPVSTWRLKRRVRKILAARKADQENQAFLREVKR